MSLPLIQKSQKARDDALAAVKRAASALVADTQPYMEGDAEAVLSVEPISLASKAADVINARDVLRRTHNEYKELIRNS